MLTSLSPAPDRVLQLTNLDLNLHQQQKLHQLSFSLQRGECVCLLGESGCGKSLTASAIIGALPASARLAGRLQIAGQSVIDRPVGQRSPATRAAMIFQDSASALNPLVSVGKQLQMTLRARQPVSRRAAQQAAIALLDEMDFADSERVMACYPAELSGGQRQRVCIALALASESPLIVADEPTSALDVATQQTVIAAFQRLALRRDAPALLFITHDLVLAAQLCSRALVMSAGRLVENSTMQQLLNRPTHAASQRLVSAARHAEQMLLTTPPLRGIA
ncbi:peptide/nickel transport system ATP-binding protein [Erwinia toletana]|uniref:Peptide/nickel transport system ATP-binding protein n=1 Tax=Winslowiella toletana TaxID=92490 RepID=A0ABS4PDR1_9GAMM|nr:ATP-binding cassette domain-containing protein [Winslowiella toletana]MBP2170068.1 peptide/nickel transport system ATP-binding protein [Winslowiella toletana]